MARIAGVNIPTNKRVVISLRYIYGIGPAKAEQICTQLAIPADRRVNQLSDDEILRIRELIDRDFQVEGDLRRELSMNIKRLMDLGCYRGAPSSSSRPPGPAASEPTRMRARAKARRSRSPARRRSRADPSLISPTFSHRKQEHGESRSSTAYP